VGGDQYRRLGTTHTHNLEHTTHDVDCR
jgi:hypothetical protein